MMLTKEDAKVYVKEQLEGYLCGCGIDTRKKFRCLNPAHQDSNPSMVFNPRKNKVHCFVCDRSWDMFDLLSFETGLTGNDLFLYGYDMYGLEVEGYAETEKKGEKRFWLSSKESKLIGLSLPYQISLLRYDAKNKEKIPCSWESFISESQMKLMVREKATEVLYKLDRMRITCRQGAITDFLSLMEEYPEYDSETLWGIAEGNNSFPEEDYVLLQKLLKRTYA